MSSLSVLGCVDTGPRDSQDSSSAQAPEPRRSSAETIRFVRALGLGWNLGNSLDAVSASPDAIVDETSWGNPRVTEQLFLSLKDDGVDSVRIPVSWRHHMGPPPDYVIDADWMDRVQEVVDYAVDNELYAIINLHHDGGDDPEGGAWIREASEDYAGTMQRYRAVWSQISERFANYSELLVFESMNEVGWDALPFDEAISLLNGINQEFTDLVRTSGGNNATRYLLVAGYFTDFAKSVRGSILPEDPAARSILSLHYYTPWQFCVTGERRTWGSSAEVAELLRLFDVVEAVFVAEGVPIILGEYGVIGTVEASSRVFWLEHVTKAAQNRGIAPFFWDNGEEVDRSTYEWRTPGLLEALVRASGGGKYEIAAP